MCWKNLFLRNKTHWHVITTCKWQILRLKSRGFSQAEWWNSGNHDSYCWLTLRTASLSAGLWGWTTAVMAAEVEVLYSVAFDKSSRHVHSEGRSSFLISLDQKQLFISWSLTWYMKLTFLCPLSQYCRPCVIYYNLLHENQKYYVVMLFCEKHGANLKQEVLLASAR